MAQYLLRVPPARLEIDIFRKHEITAARRRAVFHSSVLFR